MIQVKCKECGKPMLIQSLTDRRKFCSRQCFQQDRARAYTVEDDEGVVMPPLEHICDEGFVNLTTAIIQQARDDVMQNAPGTYLREDAEAFFLSETFYEMTNLDGFDILCKIQDKYDEKMRKKAEKRNRETHDRKPHAVNNTRSVLCIDTGVMYPNLKVAAEATGCHKSCIQEVCTKRRNKTNGLHFKYVEEGII